MPLGRRSQPSSYSPTEPLTYLESLKAVNPAAFAKIEELSKYTANEAFGGKLQDWQAQILTPLGSDIIANSKTLDLSGGMPEGVKPVESFYDDGNTAHYTTIGYTKDLGLVNGIPVTANYDINGNVTGYEGNSAYRNWLDGKNSISGNWDASGRAEPRQYTSRGGGFIKNTLSDIMSDPILGTVATIGAAYFGPLGSAALQLAQGKGLDEALKAGLLTYAGSQLTQGLSGTEIGGVNGPDNIDIGGGFNPAAGATAEQLAAARAALEGAVVQPITLSELPVGTPLPNLPTTTIDDVIKQVANRADNIDMGGGFNPATGAGDEITRAAAALNPAAAVNIDTVIKNIANAADNIDMGGGYNPATGAGDEATRAAAAGNPVVFTPNAGEPVITGNPDRAALNSNEGYGDTLTSDQITNYDKGILGAMGGGLTVGNALDYLRLGTVINALTGDPLKLVPDNKVVDNTLKPTAFEQIPIPTNWRSPTYAAAAAPIDLNSLFTDQNLLAGTQWQGLVNQRPNLTFNDIFASGMQRTPMGNPVNINQIVSAILGQDTASQKPA
jgi:hypothetical protein